LKAESRNDGATSWQKSVILRLAVLTQLMTGTETELPLPHTTRSIFTGGTWNSLHLLHFLPHQPLRSRLFFLYLRSRCLNPDKGSGEHCKVPQRGLWQNPGRKLMFVHFSVKNALCDNSYEIPIQRLEKPKTIETNRRTLF